MVAMAVTKLEAGSPGQMPRRALILRPPLPERHSKRWECVQEPTTGQNPHTHKPATRQPERSRQPRETRQGTIRDQPPTSVSGAWNIALLGDARWIGIGSQSSGAAGLAFVSRCLTFTAAINMYLRFWGRRWMCNEPPALEAHERDGIRVWTAETQSGTLRDLGWHCLNGSQGPSDGAE